MSYPMTDRAKAAEYAEREKDWRAEARTWEEASVRAAETLRHLPLSAPERYFYDAKVSACVAMSLAALHAADEYARWAEDRRRAVTA